MGRQGIFFIPLILILPGILGLSGIVWAQPAADMCAALAALWFAWKMNEVLGIKKDELAAETIAEESV